MIRPATLSDLPRLFELVQEMQASTYYAKMADPVDIDPATVRSILMDGVRRQGLAKSGGTLLSVVDVAGKLEGFMLGVLQRVYSIGNRLEAQDFWLFCTKSAPARGAGKLIDAYIEWASAIPKVAEIRLSWTDAAGDKGQRLGNLYERKGFAQCGAIYKRAGQ